MDSVLVAASPPAESGQKVLELVAEMGWHCAVCCIELVGWKFMGLNLTKKWLNSVAEI